MSRKSIGPVSVSSVWPRWFTAAASIFTLIVLTMLPRAAWAQRVKDDPNPNKPCVTKLGQTDTFYKVAFHPWCDLRELVRVYPLLDDKGKPLPVQVQLRGIYENNKDRVVDGVKIRYTVMRGCVLEGKPSPDADQEEKEYCKGLVNYFAAPSSDSIAIIEVPRSRVLTHAEKLEQLSSQACATLARIEHPDKTVLKALEECKKLGFVAVVDQKPASMQTVETTEAPAASAQPQTQNVPPAASAKQPAQESDTATSSEETGWLKALVAIFFVLFLLMGALYMREYGKNMAPILQKYEKELHERVLSMKNEFVKREQGLALDLASAHKYNQNLEQELKALKAKPTMPPVGQMQRDLEKAREDLKKAQNELSAEKAGKAQLQSQLQEALKAKTPDVLEATAMDRVSMAEMAVAEKAGEVTQLEGQIASLKHGLDAMAGERNKLQNEAKALQARIQELENKAPATLSGLGSQELAQARSDLQQANDSIAELKHQLAEAEERARLAKADSDKKDDDLRKSEAKVAERDAEIKKLEQTIANNGTVPALVAVSVAPYEKRIKDLKEQIEKQQAELDQARAEHENIQGKSAEEIQNLQATASQLASQLEQAQSTLKDKDDSIAQVRKERDQAEESLGIVGAENADLRREKRELTEASEQLAKDKSELEGANARLVREHQEIQEKYQDLLRSSDPNRRSAASYADLTRGLPDNSTAKLDQGSSQGDPTSTAKLDSSTLSSTQDGTSTSGEMAPPAIAATGDGSEDEAVSHVRMAVQPPPPADLSDTIPPPLSSPPPMNFEIMEDTVLEMIFRGSFLEVGTRRLRGQKTANLLVKTRNDLHCFHEALGIPLVWDIVSGSDLRSEFGSPKTLLDCAGIACRPPQTQHTKTQTPGQAGL